MSKEEIQEFINKIIAANGDDERQHSLEDQLYGAFIEYISTLDGELAEKAKLVLSTSDMDFARWCA